MGKVEEVSDSLVLKPQQQKVLEALQQFCRKGGPRAFILSGYAGTGKTTLLRAFVKWLSENNYVNARKIEPQFHGSHRNMYVPLASTGRAAKVLSNKIGQSTTTIHSCIYNYSGFNQDIEKMAERIEKNKGVDDTGELLLKFKFEPLMYEGRGSIYIVDEASMVSDTCDPNPTQAVFGTGRVLHDLINYDTAGKFIFVGDECQLPPVGGSSSPALDAHYLQTHFGPAHDETIQCVISDNESFNENRNSCLPVETFTLTDILRQSSENDIINAADRMRKLCANPPNVKWGKFPFKGYSHISILDSQLTLIDRYVKDVKEKGYNAATLITGSNKSCNILSNILRTQLGFTDSKIMKGELLLVTQNNLSVPLMNGDLVKVLSVGTRERQAGLTFVNVEVEEMATGMTYNTLLIEDVLYSSATNLTQRQQKALFIDFYYRERKKNIKPKTQQFDNDLSTDQYLNALRAVYGYAVTCHKAQGGEWEHVYLDIPKYISHTPQRDAYQWLYTAMTRASDRLFVADNYFIV